MNKEELQKLRDSLIKDFKENRIFNLNMKEVITRAQQMLIKIDEYNSKAEIELFKKKSFDKLDLSQNEMVYSFNFFVTILGFIDACIDKANRNVDLYDNYLEKYTYDSQVRKNEVVRNTEFITGAFFDRDDVIEDYRNIYNKKSNYTEEIFEVICTQPSYKRFVDLYVYSLDDGLIYQQLINAYNIGYMSSCEDYYEMLELYKNLLNELVKHIQYNLEEVSFVKGFQKKKK